VFAKLCPEQTYGLTRLTCVRRNTLHVLPVFNSFAYVLITSECADIGGQLQRAAQGAVRKGRGTSLTRSAPKALK
jgi:hypothetical protein